VSVGSVVGPCDSRDARVPLEGRSGAWSLGATKGKREYSVVVLISDKSGKWRHGVDWAVMKCGGGDWSLKAVSLGRVGGELGSKMEAVEDREGVGAFF
jgi:hypothetical protein